MQKIICLAIGLFLTASIIGCNATKGAGRDIEQTGKNIQETVDKND